MKHTTVPLEWEATTCDLSRTTSLNWADKEPSKIDGSTKKVVGTPRMMGKAVVGVDTDRPRPCMSNKGQMQYGEVLLYDLQCLIQHRFDGGCDTDDGEDLYRYALQGIVAKAQRLGLAVDSYAWAQQWTPLFAKNRTVGFFRRHEERALRNTYKVKPITIGKALNVKQWEVDLYGLKTIWAVDGPSEEERKAAQKTRKQEWDREYQRVRRLEQGRTPRHLSKTATKPWATLGISRPTYYRDLKANGQAETEVSSP